MFMVGSISGWEIVTRSAPSGKWKFVPSLASSCHALESVRMQDCNAQMRNVTEKTCTLCKQLDLEIFQICGEEPGCHNSSSMYNAPAIGFSRYGAISRKPILRYMATASPMTGSTVSRRMRLYPTCRASDMML